jgi:GDP-4-dehydro-6-deoxy-D-mannose reductase
MPPRAILLTGAGGFVGRHLVATLRRTHPDAVLTTEAFDVTDPAATRAAVTAARPEACVHLAAVSAVPAARQEPRHAWAVNLHGTLNLAGALREMVPECLFLFISSADAYGASFRAGAPVDEATPLAPLNTYAATKAAADLAVGAMAADGLRAIRLRAFNHTGAGQSDAFAVPAFARQLALIAAGRQEPVLRVGALDPQRDFLDVRDVCAAYAACLDRGAEVASGTILNIASGVPRRLGDVLARLVALSGLQVTIETDTARLRPTDIMTVRGDASAARRLLAWAPAIPWDETLAGVLADWRDRIAAG